MTTGDDTATSTGMCSLGDALEVEQLRQLDRLPSPDVAELIALYRHSSAGLIDQLEQSMERGDVEAVRTLTHQLKGSSASVGAGRLALLCAQVEQSVSNGGLEAGHDVPAAFRSEQQRFLQAISQYLVGLST